MDLIQCKINQYANGVSKLPDYPSDEGYTAEQLKTVFDARSDNEIKSKHNALIDELVKMFASVDNNISDSVAEHQGSPLAHSELFSEVRGLIEENAEEKLDKGEFEAHQSSADAHKSLFDELKKMIEDAKAPELDLSEYVRKTDYGTHLVPGLVKATTSFGLGIGTDGMIQTRRASNEEIDARTNGYKPIVPFNLEYAVKSVGDGYYATESELEVLRDLISGTDEDGAAVDLSAYATKVYVDNAIAAAVGNAMTAEY